MSKKRITMLAKILEAEKLKKLAEENVTEEAVDPAMADKLADDIFNQLFDQTMEESGVNKLLG